MRQEFIALLSAAMVMSAVGGVQAATNKSKANTAERTTTVKSSKSNTSDRTTTVKSSKSNTSDRTRK